MSADPGFAARIATTLDRSAARVEAPRPPRAPLVAIQIEAAKAAMAGVTSTTWLPPVDLADGWRFQFGTTDTGRAVLQITQTRPGEFGPRLNLMLALSQHDLGDISGACDVAWLEIDAADAAESRRAGP